MLAMLELPHGSVSGLLDTILVSPALLRHQLEQVMFGHRAAPDEPLPTGSIAITTELEACLHSAQGMAAEAQVPEVAPEHVLLPILFRAEATGQTGYAEIGLTVAVLAARIGVPAPGR
ncbi:hypothetical protein EI291_04750 [Hymenobacter rigui]|uniref:Clp R domain-containing protein n=2 Tax=Hymenobacter rigui TaxID=334424 RepID=A0A3R9MNK9_9BACT|nr:hypothetical protein EI291_04750 [Hymenobacter rigui]